MLNRSARHLFQENHCLNALLLGLHDFARSFVVSTIAACRRKASWFPILGCRKLVECVLLYPFRWFFAFVALPLRFARAWHSVTVSKRREGGRHSIHRRESGLIWRCLAATTSKRKICFACTFGCGGRISLFVFRLDLHFSSFKNDVSQTKRGSSSKNELGWPASL